MCLTHFLVPFEERREAVLHTHPCIPVVEVGVDGRHLGQNGAIQLVGSKGKDGGLTVYTCQFFALVAHVDAQLALFQRGSRLQGFVLPRQFVRDGRERCRHRCVNLYPSVFGQSEGNVQPMVEHLTVVLNLCECQLIAFQLQLITCHIVLQRHPLCMFGIDFVDEFPCLHGVLLIHTPFVPQFVELQITSSQHHAHILAHLFL